MIVNKILLNTPLPDDVVTEHINKYISTRTLIDSCRVNKYLNNEIKSLYLKNIKFIQKIYKKYRVLENQLESPWWGEFSRFRRLLRLQKKHTWYRYYIAKYPMEYVKIYPEFLTSKVRSNPRKLTLTNWINNNLPTDNEKRTRRDLLNFFQKNDITVNEMAVAGW